VHEPDSLTEDLPLTEGLPPTEDAELTGAPAPTEDLAPSEESSPTEDPAPTGDVPLTGRHRATPATLRQVARRVGLGAGALLVVAALAVLTAAWTGLNGAPRAVEQVRPPAPPTVSTGPTFGRTVDLDATRADRATPSTEAPTAVAETPALVPASTPAPEPTSAPEPKPSPEPPAGPAPLPSVQPGDPCVTEGARTTSAAGKTAVCTARGDGAPRWRHA
jgi:hypothetical protein